MLRWTLAAAMLALGMATGYAQKDEPVKDYDKKEMDAAIEKAKKTVDDFVTEFQKGDGKFFSVKAPITDNGETEHFWLGNLEYNDGVFTGKIDNEPGIVKNVQQGQTWTIKKEDISDWMFLRARKMHGNFTLRPMLKTMPKEEADKLRAILADEP